MERDCATGRPFPDKPLIAGVQALAIMSWVRWASPLSLADISLRGYGRRSGRSSNGCPWPAVLVTKARSTDGTSLDLVVEPGTGGRRGRRCGAPPVRAVGVDAGGPLPVARGPLDLEVVADGRGRAVVLVTVDRRVELRLEPAAALMVNRWWQRMMGWTLWLRRRPRCANTPFEPAPRPIVRVTLRRAVGAAAAVLLVIAVCDLIATGWLGTGERVTTLARSLAFPGIGFVEWQPLLASFTIMVGVGAMIAWLRWGADWLLLAVWLGAAAVTWFVVPLHHDVAAVRVDGVRVLRRATSSPSCSS